MGEGGGGGLRFATVSFKSESIGSSFVDLKVVILYDVSCTSLKINLLNGVILNKFIKRSVLVKCDFEGDFEC